MANIVQERDLHEALIQPSSALGGLGPDNQRGRALEMHDRVWQVCCGLLGGRNALVTVAQHEAVGPLLAFRKDRDRPAELDQRDLDITAFGLRELGHVQALAAEQVLEHVTWLLVVLEDGLLIRYPVPQPA